MGTRVACPIAARSLVLKVFRSPEHYVCIHCEALLKLVSRRIWNSTTRPCTLTELVIPSLQLPSQHVWCPQLVKSVAYCGSACAQLKCGKFDTLNMALWVCVNWVVCIPWCCVHSFPWWTRIIAPYLKTYKTDFVWYAAKQNMCRSSIYIS